jgi:hypothetical protein
MLYLNLVVFVQRLQELHLRKTIGHNEDSLKVWALHVFASGMPRNRACDAQSALTRFDCYGISCYYLLVQFVHRWILPCASDRRFQELRSNRFRNLIDRWFFLSIREPHNALGYQFLCFLISVARSSL